MYFIFDCILSSKKNFTEANYFGGCWFIFYFSVVYVETSSPEFLKYSDNS